MPWQPLPDDVPLDHEAAHPVPPPTLPDAPIDTTHLTPLPEDAQLDEPAPEPPAAEASAATGPTAPLKSQEVHPTYTQKGFEVQPDAHYYTELSAADKKEYSGFFTDPKSPPDPEKLRDWYFNKTGMMLTNADQIVEVYRKTGKFRTDEAPPKFPTEDKGKAGSYGQHAANSILGDFGAEVSAPVGALLPGDDRPNVWNSDASFGNLVAQNADMTRAQLDRDTEEHPYASAGGELTGIAVAAPVGGAVADVARVGKLGEVAAPILKGTAGGAIYGAGSAGPGNRAAGAEMGAALGTVVPLGVKIPAAGYNGVRTILEGSPGTARSIIAKAIKDDANTPSSVGADIAAAHANDVPMALGDTGENVRGLMAASSRSSGMARTITRDALENRQADLADRVVGHIERDLGPIANPHELADQMMTKAHNDAAPLYEKAYGTPVSDAFLTKAEPLLQRPSMKKALANAARIAREEGADPSELGLVTDEAGNVAVSRTPTWRTLDYIKRGMDDVVEGYRDKTTRKLVLDTEGRAVNNTLRSYLSLMDKANPDYAAARAAYAGPIKGIAAMNDGRKALSLSADDLEARIRGLSPYEKDMYALGTRRAMAELVRAKGDTADVIGALMGSGKKRAMLARLFGDRKNFQRFVNTLGQEREGWRSYKQALQGSPTAANLADDATLDVTSTAAEMVAHGGIPVTVAIRKAAKLFSRQLGEKTKQQIAALLSNTDPAALRELAAELADRARKRGVRRRRVNATANQVGKVAAVLTGEQSQ